MVTDGQFSYLNISVTGIPVVLKDTLSDVVTLVGDM